MAYQPKSYRKFVATAATATLVATAFAPFASAHSFKDVETKYNEAVDYLVSKGVTGYTDGTFKTQQTITRLEAAEMLGKALGLTEVKDAPASGFTDVPARVATLINAFKAKGITAGKTATTFGANDNITRGELAIWIQKAYDLKAKEGSSNKFGDVAERYKVAVQALVDNEITQGTTETTFGTTANAKRGDYALFIKRAVDAATPKVTTATKVESVSATNLKEVDVTFDGTVDAASAEDKEKYTLASGTIDSAELLEDGKTVRLTLVGKLSNQVANKLTVNNVKAGESAVSVKDFVFTPVDNTLPTVVEVKNLGTKALKIVFSEPIATTSSLNYKLDGKNFFGSTTQGSREVILTPYESSALSVGEHTLTVAGAEDYFGLKSLSSEHKFTVVEDKVAPTVASVEATLERVVVTFSEEVDPTTVTTSNVYWKSGDTKMTAVGKKQLASNKFEFDFTGKALPGYETILFVEGVKDYSGNQISETQVKVQATVDQTRPEVTEVKVDSLNAKLITIKFNKPVTAADKKYFTITNSAGDVVIIKQVTKAAGDSTNKIFTIETYDALEGTNTLKVSGIRDLTTLNNTMLDYSTTVSVGDKKAPEYAGISASNAKRQINIAFNEKMDLSTLANPANYLITVNGNVRNLPEGTEVTPVQDGKAVLITLPERYDNTVISFPATIGGAGSVTEIQVMGVKDLAGNILKDFSKKVDVIAENVALKVYDTTVNASANAALTAKNTVKVRFNQPIGKASVNDFTVTDNSNVAISNVSTNGTEYVTLTLSGTGLSTTDNFGIDLKSDNTIETVTGNRTAASLVSLVIYDLVKPEVKLASGVTTLAASGANIVLPFSERLDATTQSNYKYDLVVTRISDGKVLPFTDYTTTVVADAAGNAGHAIQITLGAGYVGEYSVSVRDNAVHIVDRKGNKAVKSSTYSTALGAVDAVIPTFIAASSKGIDSDNDGKLNAIELKFSKAMKLQAAITNNADAKKLITALTVNNGTSDVSLVDKMTGITVSGDTLTITLDNSVVGTGQIKVSIDAVNNGFALTDLVGNLVANQARVEIADVVKPVAILLTATNGSTAATITFSEAVKNTDLLATTDLTTLQDTTPGTATAIADTRGADANIAIVLSANAATGKATVVTLTAAGASKVTDLAGNIVNITGSANVTVTP